MQDRNFSVFIILTGQKSVGQKLNVLKMSIRTEIDRTEKLFFSRKSTGQK